jgi:uncharacterized membrane protein
LAHVLQVLDGQARKVFDAVYPASASDVTAAQQTARSLNGLTPVQKVSAGAVGQVVVALDRTAIADLAVRYDAVIQLVPAIGDHVRPGGTLLNVYGSRELPERRLRRAVVLGDERTISGYRCPRPGRPRPASRRIEEIIAILKCLVVQRGRRRPART